jgi:hypothetical protein
MSVTAIDARTITFNADEVDLLRRLLMEDIAVSAGMLAHDAKRAATQLDAEIVGLDTRNAYGLIREAAGLLDLLGWAMPQSPS